jgi:hypothetical protein
VLLALGIASDWHCCKFVRWWICLQACFDCMVDMDGWQWCCDVVVTVDDVEAVAVQQLMKVEAVAVCVNLDSVMYCDDAISFGGLVVRVLLCYAYISQLVKVQSAYKYKYFSVITNNYKLMRGLRTPFELHGTPVGLTPVDSSGLQWISPVRLDWDWTDNFAGSL